MKNKIKKANRTSPAKREANRRNAQKSSGPRTGQGKMRSRCNAWKHGLTARTAWPGEHPQRNQDFFARFWLRLGPRNALEEVWVANLLQTRFKEELLLAAETTLLERKPAPLMSSPSEPYPWLFDEKALATLKQLTRHLAHQTLLFERIVERLLKCRAEKWATRQEDVGVGMNGGNANPAGAQEPPPGPEDSPGPPPAGTRALESWLADSRLTLPGQDPDAYAALASALWNTFAPANALEEFIVIDFIQAQASLDRVRQFGKVLLDRCAVSAMGRNCGYGFAVIHDSQRGQALETLREWEAVLLKRLERRHQLLQKVRKAGWVDSGPSPETEAKHEPPALRPLTPPPGSDASPPVAQPEDQPPGPPPVLSAKHLKIEGPEQTVTVTPGPQTSEPKELKI